MDPLPRKKHKASSNGQEALFDTLRIHQNPPKYINKTMQYSLEKEVKEIIGHSLMFGIFS